MPALNFHARFADAVERGEKTQTIRAHRKDGRDPKVGDRLYLYTGQRTKACRKLGEGRCVEVAPVFIDKFTQGLCWSVGRRPLTRHERGEFAREDGFSDSTEMLAWFQETHGLPFEGVLIRWELCAAVVEGEG